MRMEDMPIIGDRYAYLLLTTTLALPKQSTLKPFTPSDWNRLEEVLLKKCMSPGDLLQITNDNIIQESPKYGNRIIDLLNERGKLPIIIDNLKNKGIKIICRSDDDYSQRLLQLLGRLSPTIFFYSGNISLLNNDSIGFVGSRDADEGALSFTRIMATRCAKEGITVVSGGARGVDQTAMDAAIQSGGTAIGFLSDSLELSIRKPDWRKALIEGRLLLLSSQLPWDRFTVWAAMGRNKYIYAQSRCTIVVTSTYNKGGTWEGAKENMKHGWTPMYVRDIGDADSGNGKLLETGMCYPIVDLRLTSPSPLKELYSYRGTEPTIQPIVKDNKPDEVATTTVCTTLFGEFRIILLNILSTGDRSESDIANMLGLKNSPLLEPWIKKALNEGIIVRPGKKKVYHVNIDSQNATTINDSNYELYPLVKEQLIRVLTKSDMKLKEITKKLEVSSEKQMKIWLDKAKEECIIDQSKTGKYVLRSKQKKLGE